MKHVVGFSGGIDSQACARWVLNRYPKEDVILLNSDAGGNEHPITTEFINWYSQNVHPVVLLKPIIADLGKSRKKATGTSTRKAEFAQTDELTFERLAYIKNGFPSRRRQFCTEYLKLAPANRWIRENIKGEWRRYSGVRRDESNARKNYPIVGHDERLGCELHYPIADWTKQMCFDYVAASGEKINELYTFGFERVGCAPCVNSGKNDVLAWATRFPEMIDKVREWEKRTGLTFFAPCVPGLEINWIDQVVDWAKTMRGGRQYSLLVLQEPPTCESNYGLCE